MKAAPFAVAIAMLVTAFCQRVALTATVPPSASITGVVRGPDGKPVAGALVAANRYGGGPDLAKLHPSALVLSQADGAFTLDGLTDGTYGITATTSTITATYAGDVTIAGGSAPPPVTLTLGGAGEVLAGVARDAGGAPVARAEVRAIRSSEADGDTFVAVSGANGSYRVALPPARYTVIVADGERVLSWTSFVSDPTLREPPPAAVLDWLRTNAIRLTTVEAGHGFADMAPLSKIVGKARVVALGEATHGTREFFQLKHRMLEFLVSEMGFNVFGIEATMPEAFEINDYILTGSGDPEKALAALYFWTWNTDEVLAMIRWMRRWNADPVHARKVTFYGFDMQSAPRAVRVAVDYLRRVDPALAARASRDLSTLANPLTAPFAGGLADDAKRALTKVADELVAGFDANESAWGARTGHDAWALARQHARIVQQNVAMNTATGNGRFLVRDRSMAENIAWILAREGLGAKMAVWAHDGHVGTDAIAGAPSMGRHLRTTLGGDVVVFGVAFDQGSFQAIDVEPGSGGLRVFTVDPAPPGSLDGALALAAAPIAAIDLRAVPKQGPVATWFAADHRTRQIGAVFRAVRTDDFRVTQRVASVYDALLFVKRTTAARPLPGSRGRSREHAAAPRNLDFEEGAAGETPVGWVADESERVFGFEMTTSVRGCASGTRCGVVSRAPGHHYGETAGTLYQDVDATPYRGKRVRLRAQARIETTKGAGEVYLYLRARGASSSMEQAGLRELLAVDSPAWRPYEVAGDVPADAIDLDFGIALIGDAKAYIDAVTIEIVPKQGRVLASARKSQDNSPRCSCYVPSREASWATGNTATSYSARR